MTAKSRRVGATVVGAVSGERLTARMDKYLDGLERHRSETAHEMAAAIVAEEPEYAVPDNPLVDSALEAFCEDVLLSFARLVRSGRPPSEADFDFVRVAAVREARRGVSLEGLMHAYRVGQRVAWRSSFRRVGDSPEDMRVVLLASDHSVEHFNLLSTIAADAYTEQRRHSTADADRTKRDLVEEMLAGDRQLSSASRRVLSSLGFRPSAECRAVVAAVREDGGCGEADATRMAMEAIDKALACGGEAPLIVARHAEVLAVVLEHAFSTFLERLAQTASDLKRTRGISIAAGASLVCQGFEGMPVAHRQAQLALRQARNGQVLTLSEASLLSYLVSAADATGRAIVPLEVKELMAKDVRCRGALLETLLAYMDADLNVARVARTLFVHPNTVHYRLHRIEKITGRSTRSFRDLVELLIAIETLRSGSDSTAPEPGRTPRSPRSGPAG